MGRSTQLDNARPRSPCRADESSPLLKVAPLSSRPLSNQGAPLSSAAYHPMQPWPPSRAPSAGACSCDHDEHQSSVRLDPFSFFTRRPLARRLLRSGRVRVGLRIASQLNIEAGTRGQVKRCRQLLHERERQRSESQLQEPAQNERRREPVHSQELERQSKDSGDRRRAPHGRGQRAERQSVRHQDAGSSIP